MKIAAADLAALPLAERCAVARLLAIQLAESMAWPRNLDRYAPNGRARLLVFLGDSRSRLLRHRRLLGVGERCRGLTRVQLPRLPGASRVQAEVLLGEAGRRAVPYLTLWLSAATPASARPRFTFAWRLSSS